MIHFGNLAYGRSRPAGRLRRHPLIVFWTLAYALSWLLWMPLWLPWFGAVGVPALPFNHALGAYGPITAALLTAGLVSGRLGVWDLVRRMVAWRGRLMYLGVALLGPPLLLALVLAAAWLFGAETAALRDVTFSSRFPYVPALGLFTYNVATFGFGEEVGWRGFVLPRLQARHSAMGATLLLTSGWALWHLPLFLYRPEYSGMGVAGAAGWFLSLLSGAVVLTWLYNESEGSILVVAIFHAAIDTVFTSGLSSGLVANGIGVLITSWAIVVLVVAGPGNLSRRGKRSGCTVPAP